MSGDSSIPGKGALATDADLRAPGASEEASKKQKLQSGQHKRHVLAGKYLLEREIARGAMGRVFLATQISLKRRVAVKVMAPRYGGPDFDKRFMLEARSAAALSHRNIVTVHDYGRTKNNLLFMAMEYLDGPTLVQLMSEEKHLSYPRACNIVQQIARALRAAHGMGLIHRDLKPGNVILLDDADEGDYAKVLDFGLAKVQPAGELADEDGPITRDGLMIGTPRYMSPEQIRLEAVDERTDIYALGGILFFLLTGRPAYDGPSDVEILHAQLKTDPPSVTSFEGCEDLPVELDAVIAKCMARDAAQRYRHASEVIDTLRKLVQELTQEHLPDEPEPEPEPEATVEAPVASIVPPAPSSGRANLMAGVVMALALVVGAVGWQALEGTNSAAAEPARAKPKPKPKPKPTRVAVLTDPEGIEVVSTTGGLFGETPFIAELAGPTTVRFRYKGVDSEPRTLSPKTLEHRVDLRPWVKKVKWSAARKRPKPVKPKPKPEPSGDGAEPQPEPAKADPEPTKAEPAPEKPAPEKPAPEKPAPEKPTPEPDTP